MTTANLALQDNDSVVQYTSVGEAEFSTTFPVLTAAELKVSVNQGVLTYGADYTIDSGLGDAGGVTITILAGTTAGDQVTLWLDLPIERLSGYGAGAATLLPEDLNADAVLQLRVAQMLRRDIRRALRLPVDDPLAGQDMELPIASERLNRLLYFSPSTGAMELLALTEIGGISTALSSSLIAATLNSLVRTPAEITAGVTPSDGSYAEGHIVRYGGSQAASDNSTALTRAIAVSAAGGAPAYLPAGTWLGKVTMLAGAKLKGAGRDQTTLKIPAGDTGTLVSGANIDGVTIEDLTLDGTGAGGASTASVAFFNNCDDLALRRLRSQSAPGAGLWLNACERYTLEDIHVDDAGAISSGEWGMQIDACKYGQASNLRGTNCANRFVMVRTGEFSNFFGINAKGNGGTALWFQDCLYCHGVGGVDEDDFGGDSWVIEGGSIGCSMRSLAAYNCGGHGGAISSDGTVAPVDCHIDGLYSEDQGEAMAAITDQGSGFKPVNCSITNVRGRNCGRVTPMEAFGLANCIGCLIEGSVSDNTHSFTYAALQIGNEAGNRFVISGWVAGATGYFSTESADTSLHHTVLETRLERRGDADFSWNPAVNGQQIIFDQASLTAERTVTLGDGWTQQRVRVSRPAAGAFNLLVKQGSTTLATLAAAEWADFIFDGANWVLVAYGALA